MRLGSAALRRFLNPIATLLLLDLVAAGVAFYLAVGIRFGFDFQEAQESLSSTIPRFASFGACIFLGLISMGLYRLRQRPTSIEMVARVILAVALGGAANVLLFYFFPDLTLGRGVLVIGLAISCGTLVGSRLGILSAIDANPMKRRVLVIGAGEVAAKVSRLRRRSDRRRFDVVGYVPMSDEDRLRATELGGMAVLTLDEAGLLRDLDEIVVALDDRRGHLPLSFLLRQKQRGAMVSDIIDFLERETERLDLDILRPSWLLYERSSQAAIIYRWFKRFFDVFFGTVFMILCLPLIFTVVLFIWMEDGIRQPVFYRQRRVGRHGRLFFLLKLRSMRVDAEESSGPRFSTSNDDRVTRVGRFIRRFRIDELPQMLNVIRGDMSLVGPRPERPEFVEEISRQIPLYFYRHDLRPGLTGWAQLNFPYGASLGDTREKLTYDLFYIKNASVVVDLLILLQTVEVVVLGRGTTMSGIAPQRRRD